MTQNYQKLWRTDGKVEVIDVKLNNRKTKKIKKNYKQENNVDNVLANDIKTREFTKIQ